MPFTKEFLLFYHQQGHYSVGLSPLQLVWRDHIDVDSIYIHLCSVQTPSGWVLVTYEGYMVHWLHQDVIDVSLVHGGLVVGTASSAHVDASGAAAIEAFQVLGLSERKYADSWSKIVFSQMTRSAPISLADMCG